MNQILDRLLIKCFTLRHVTENVTELLYVVDSVVAKFVSFNIRKPKKKLHENFCGYSMSHRIFAPIASVTACFSNHMAKHL